MPLANFTYTLTWSDFTPKNTRPAGEKEDAQIHPDVSFSNFQLASKGKAVIIKDVDMDLHLVPVDCWVVSSAMTADLLKHEQGHYDIMALSAREIYNDLLALKGTSTNDLQKKAGALKTKAQKKVKQVDDRYDVKTSHSQNANVQKTWDQSIATELQKPNGSIDNLPQ